MNKFAIVSGSHKVNGSSDRVAAHLADLVTGHLPDSEANIVSLAALPFWDEGMWGEQSLVENWSAWGPIADTLRAADALIVISPEYGGMVPPRLTNFLLLCSGKEIGHKPALAVGVSASRGGSYPITQLRSYAYKNNHVCWIPDHLIVRNVDAEPNALAEDSYEGRLALYCVRLLDAYASALKTVRQCGVVDHETYPYGM